MANPALNDVVTSGTPKVHCDGNVDSNGHPRIYLDMSKTGEVVCPYCSKTFKWIKQDTKN